MRYARNVIRFARLCGANEARLLATSGLDAARLDDIDGWLEGEIMTAIWAAAVVETGDPDFGLRLGAQAQAGAISALGYAMLSADTVGDALDVLARFGPLIATVRAIRFDRAEHDRPAVVEMVPHATGPLARNLRQPLEATMATFMAITRAVTGRSLATVHVSLAHARPATGAETHAELFGVAPEFGAAAYSVAVDPAALDWRSRSASPALFASFVREAERAMRAVTGSIRARTMAAIEARFEGRVPTLKDIAADLALGERTLQRHLGEEGTTFQDLCDEVRRDLAARYLRHPDQTVEKVAYLLGYSAPSAFHRAFRRWTGQTPGAFRRALARMETHDGA